MENVTSTTSSTPFSPAPSASAMPTPPLLTTTEIAIIAGSSAGGLLILLLCFICVCIVCCCCVKARRTRRRAEVYIQEMMEVESKGEHEEKSATDNAQLMVDPDTDGLYLPLEIDNTNNGCRQPPVNATNVQGATEEYYAPMDLDLGNHNQTNEVQPQVSEEYYVEVDEDHRKEYNEGQAVEEQEYYTPMEAGIVPKSPLLLVNPSKGGLKTASQTGDKKAGKSESDQNGDQRERSDTVPVYANTSEWTAGKPLPSSAHSYVNVVVKQQKEGQKQTAAGTKSPKKATVTASKPPQTAPKPAKAAEQELPIYGNLDIVPEPDNNDEDSEAEEEYVVP